MTASGGAGPIGTALHLGYAVAGLVIGGAWAFGRDLPVWEHALRLFVIVLIVPPIVHLIRRRLGRLTHASPPLRRLVVAKVLLVAGAVGLELLLDQFTARAPFITAAALAVTVAGRGPTWHRKHLPDKAAERREPARRSGT